MGRDNEREEQRELKAGTEADGGGPGGSNKAQSGRKRKGALNFPAGVMAVPHVVNHRSSVPTQLPHDRQYTIKRLSHTHNAHLYSP